MYEESNRQTDEDPAPVKESDAERVSGEQASDSGRESSEPAGTPAPAGDDAA